MNVHNSKLFYESFSNLLELADLLDLDLMNSYLALDSGFDNFETKSEIRFRKLVIRYEKLQSTFMGFRYLAYSMVNFRWIFGKD